MKKLFGEPEVEFIAKVEGEMHKIRYPASYLRKLWEERKVNEGDFRFSFEANKEEFTFSLPITEVMKHVRKAELTQNIIPLWLQAYLVDLTQESSNHPTLPEKGRDMEIEKIWSALSRKKDRNAILAGETDVGKTTLACEIVRQIATNECPVEFSKSRVIMLKTNDLLQLKRDAEHAKDLSVYLKRIEYIQKFIYKNKEDIIIYIDQLIHMKYDESLAVMLYKMIGDENVRILATVDKEFFEDYFLYYTALGKHLNEIEICEPEPEEIFSMIESRVKQLQREHRVKISKKTIDFAIATSYLTDSVSAEPGNVMKVLSAAFSEAKRKGKKVVDKQCVISYYNTSSKLYAKTSLEEKKVIAYHELGHYIVSKKCQHLVDRKINFVSILPMINFLGVNVWYTELGKKLVYDREYLEESIAASLGGRVCEEKITNKFSTGASEDLHNADSMAKRLLMVYGMSNNNGNANRSYILNYYYLTDALLTEKKKEEINREIGEIIDKCFKIAQKIIDDNWELIERLASELLEKQIMTDEELEEICREYEM